MSSEQKQTKRAAVWRKEREKEGLSQTQIWLPVNLRAEVDARIKAGEFQNRSEAITAALSQMIGAQQCSPQ